LYECRFDRDILLGRTTIHCRRHAGRECVFFDLKANLGATENIVFIVTHSQDKGCTGNLKPFPLLQSFEPRRRAPIWFHSPISHALEVDELRKIHVLPMFHAERCCNNSIGSSDLCCEILMRGSTVRSLAWSATARWYRFKMSFGILAWQMDAAMHRGLSFSDSLTMQGVAIHNFHRHLTSNRSGSGQATQRTGDYSDRSEFAYCAAIRPH